MIKLDNFDFCFFETLFKVIGIRSFSIIPNINPGDKNQHFPQDRAQENKSLLGNGGCNALAHGPQAPTLLPAHALQQLETSVVPS